MTRETAKRIIRNFPLAWQDQARKDIDERLYVETTLVPLFELDDGYFQMDVNYKIKLPDVGYVYGKSVSIEEFAKFHEEAARGEVFRLLYLKNAKIILECEELKD